MPITITTSPGGTAYADIRVGTVHNIHQALVVVAGVTADADGMIPPGLPLQADGTVVSGASQTAKYVVGPEAVRKGAANHFANAILDGALNQDMIEDNLGRPLTANEVSALTAGNFTLI